MTPDYKLCDLCGAKTTIPPLFIETDYSFNGVENVRSGETYDLCGPCLHGVTKKLLKLPFINHEEANDFVKTLKRVRK